jgi:hypothetical protein
MKWLILVLTIIFSSFTYSSSQCESEKLYLIFHKGANTRADYAEDYMNEVKKRIKDLYKTYNLYSYTSINPEDIEVIYMPNPVQPVMKEKVPELFQEYFAFEGGSLELTEQYVKDLKDTFKQVHGDYDTYDKQLAIYKAILLGETNPAYPVTKEYSKGNAIIIAHSQGNMQLKAIQDTFLRIQPELANKVKVMSIGSPVTLSFVNSYVMDKYDMLRPLNGYEYNTNNDIPLWEAMKGGSHGFIEYLDGTLSNESDNLKWGSAPKINSFLVDAIKKLGASSSGGYAVKFVLDKKGNPSVYMGVNEVNAGVMIPNMVIPPADPMYIYIDQSRNYGQLTTSLEDDVYRVKCEDIPIGTTLFNPGAWHDGANQTEVNMTRYLFDGNIATKDYWVDGNPEDSSYSGKLGVYITKDENGTLSY